MKRMVLALVAAALSAPAAAQDEALARVCNAAYVKLCKGIKPGPELIGQCFQKYPNILDKIPQKCQTDFQTNVENYREAKGQQ